MYKSCDNKAMSCTCKFSAKAHLLGKSKRQGDWRNTRKLFLLTYSGRNIMRNSHGDKTFKWFAIQGYFVFSHERNMLIILE